MQRSFFNSRTNTRLLLVFFLSGGLLFGMLSCKDPKNTPIAAGPSCVTVSNTKIKNAWVTSGYTTPGNRDYIVWLKFLTSYGGPGTDFVVRVRGLRADYSEVSGSDILLSPGTDCLVTLPNDIAIGYNSIKLEDLGILQNDGSLKTDFNYLKLTPQRFPENPYFMNYSLDAVFGGSTSAGKSTLPCPPCVYCRPPCPPDSLTDRRFDSNPVPGPVDTARTSTQ
jgi:hypothetical protein